MITGIGSDIVDIRRIQRLLEQKGEAFKSKSFTEGEREQAESKKGEAVAARYAKYFAAKEACIKALGGSNGRGFSWQDFSISYDGHGKPLLTLSGAAAQALPDKATIHLSLSDDPPYALAFVVIEQPL